LSSIFLYYPIWELQELLDARPHIDDSVTEEQVRKRFRKFGGVPRNIFGDKAQQRTALEKQDRGLDSLKPDFLELVIRGRVRTAESIKPDAPESSVVGFEPFNDYQQTKAVLLSPRVIDRVAALYLHQLASLMSGAFNGSHLGHVFEAYLRHFMTLENAPLQYRLPGGTKKSQQKHLTLPKCTAVEQVDCIWTAARDGADCTLYHSSEANFKLADMVVKQGTVYYALQATVGMTHSLNVQHLNEAAETLQLEQRGEKLLLLYAVTDGRWATFRTVPTRPLIPARCSVLVVQIPLLRLDPRGDDEASDEDGDGAGDETSDEDGDGAGDEDGDEDGDGAGDEDGDGAGDEDGDGAGDGAGDETKKRRRHASKAAPPPAKRRRHAGKATPLPARAGGRRGTRPSPR
jgi:hypothetical protein